MYSFEYTKDDEVLDKFKNFVLLMEANGGNISYVGMTRDEFLSLGGKKVGVDSTYKIDKKNLLR